MRTSSDPSGSKQYTRQQETIVVGESIQEDQKDVDCHLRTNQSRTDTSTQNETTPSDLEIMRRVLQIKSKWTATECIRRRREAENRFVDLMCQLGVEAA